MRKRVYRVVRRFLVALACAAASSLALADQLTDRAKALLERKDAKAAYELLAPAEQQRAGDPEFDYLLGIAALDAGEPERAVFALERVLAVQPDHHLARAEIARAYLAMGERDSARREFQTVRAQSIPDDAKASIDRVLSAIAASDITQIAGFAELGVGHDSNVNSATGSGQIAIPALGGIIATLSPGATQRSDSFTSLSGGVSLTHKLTPEWAIVGAAAGYLKHNSSVKGFDTSTFDLNLGARWSRDKEAVTVGGQFQDFDLQSTAYRVTNGVIAQWQHNFDENRQGTLFAQRSELRYPSQTVRNANRNIIGAAYAQAFPVAYSPVLFASVYGGREREIASGVPFLGHTPWGVRVGAQARLGGGWSLFANAAYEERRYGGPDPFFLVTRKDRQSDLGAGVSYLLRPGITLIGQLSQTDNRSNVDLNRFHRTLGSIAVRFNF